MNVAFDSWIPVVTTSGKSQLASLREVFADGAKFSDLAVRPHERIALMRLLLCVAHAALDGPKDYGEWLNAPKRLPAAATQYLKTWQDSFELFHAEKPWLQVASLSKTAQESGAIVDSSGWTPTTKLSFTYATGNNTTLFDHKGMLEARPTDEAELAISLLTYQCFSPGGLISHAYWGGTRTSKSSKDAPCVPASMIHALLRGPNLVDSIHLNLPTYDDIYLYYGKRETGRPVWEQALRSLDDRNGIENATRTYVGRLVPMARFIRLHSNRERMLLGAGLEYPTFNDDFPQEPTATVVLRRIAKVEKRTVLQFRPSRAFWRELGAIFVKQTAESGGGGPLSLRAIQNGHNCDLIVGALARDQANVIDTAESVFHISQVLANPEGVAAYESEVGQAEQIARRLGRAVEGYRSFSDGGWDGRLKGAGANKRGLQEKLHSSAATQYWTSVEGNLPQLMAHIGAIGTTNSVPTRVAWRKTLVLSASDAYRTACGQETPRQVRAFAEGWKRLFNQKTETESTEEDEA